MFRKGPHKLGRIIAAFGANPQSQFGAGSGPFFEHKPQAHLNYAIMIEHEHPRKSLKELKKAKAPKDWSLESRGIVVEKA